MILVTGFGPYHEDTNASGVLVQSLIENLPEELFPLREHLVFEVLTCDTTSRETEHQTLETMLSGLLERYMPELCIFTGQAAALNKVTIEKIAINSFLREIISADRPAAYWSNLPGTDTLTTALENEGIPASYSFYGGQHLCNHILFSSLYFAEKYNLPHKSGFIHVPVLPEQVIKKHRDSPYLPIAMSRKALSLIISHVVASHGYDSVPQPKIERSS